MQILQGILFIFILNSPNQNYTDVSLRNALVNNWRLVEIAKKGTGKVHYQHPRVTYKFAADGTGRASSKKKVETFKWRIDNKNLFFKMNGNGKELKINMYFVKSTRAARKKVKAYKKGVNVALLFIEAMPVLSK